MPSNFRSVPLLDLLPEHAASLLRSPSAGLLSGVRASGQKPKCFLVSRTEYVTLVRRMCSAGLFGLAHTPMVVNGLFGVPKPDGSLRLIVDARAANSVFCVPPVVSLPSPSVFSNLVGDKGTQLYIAKTDVDNFYHRLAIPIWLQAYFCFPPLSVSELDDQRSPSTEHPGRLMYPCCLSLPMGWSFSVYFAQLAHGISIPGHLYD